MLVYGITTCMMTTVIRMYTL